MNQERSNPISLKRALSRPLAWMVLALFVAATVVVAQQSRSRGYRGWGRSSYDSLNSPRQIEQHGGFETPMWTNTPGFEKDAFTFVRIIRSNGGRGGRGDWTTDTPDSDLNFSFRLQQLTSIKVNPNGLFLRLTDPALMEQPFIYMVEPGSLYLEPEEIIALRKYLLNGGFLWLDDFWGDNEWENVEQIFKEVFPERAFEELPLDHPLYHCVFEIKSKGQVPNVMTGTQSEYTGVTFERYDAREVHHRVIKDDKGRLMVFATHNTDNGDGWEREGDNHYYFANFSEKIAYPLAVNVVFYVMTH